MAGDYAKGTQASSGISLVRHGDAQSPMLSNFKALETQIPIMGDLRKKFSLSTGIVTAVTDFDFALHVLWRVSPVPSEQIEGLRSPRDREMCIWSAHIIVAARFSSDTDGD
jgi:hypothetical protein